jgi:hypothetical protein
MMCSVEFNIAGREFVTGIAFIAEDNNNWKGVSDVEYLDHD